jgi:hypothetical protein
MTSSGVLASLSLFGFFLDPLPEEREEIDDFLLYFMVQVAIRRLYAFLHCMRKLTFRKLYINGFMAWLTKWTRARNLIMTLTASDLVVWMLLTKT